MKTKLPIGLPLVVALVMTLAAATPASSQFRIPLIIRDNANDSTNLATKRDTVYFGVHPQATYCIDPAPLFFSPCDSVKEAELPPPPPAGVFDARWVDLDEVDDPCILGMEYDIRRFAGTSDVDTFQLKFQPGAGKYPMIVRWPQGLSQFADSMRLRASGTGVTVNVNMFNVDSAKFNSATIRFLRIYVYHPKNQTAPPVPTLTFPAHLAAAVDTPVTFTWLPSAGAASYIFQLSASPTFATILRRDTTTGTSLLVRNLAYNQTYYWRVSANTPFLKGCFQTPANSFSTIITCLEPTLTAPANNAVNVATSPTLSWNAPTGATVLRYELQMATDLAFANIVFSNTNIVTTSTTVGPLLNCVARYWRVRTICDAGPSAYTTGFRFTVANAVPEIPTLLLPANNATNVATSATFTWSVPDSCSRSYRIQVSGDTTDANPASLAVNDSVQTPSRAVTGLAEGTDYWWHVRAAGTAGVGAYSGWRKFRTGVTPPGIPTLLSPAAGDTSVPISAILRWSTVVRADSYQVQVATDNAFAAIVYNGAYTVDTTATAGPLVNCTQYFWRARAKNLGGAGNFTAARNFRIASAPPAAPVLAFPANGQDSIDGQPTLTWASGDICTNLYRLEVGTDAGLSSPIVDVTIALLNREIGPLESNTTYFWRVTPIGSAGSGTPSAVFSFVTTPFTPPPSPVLSSPPNRQTNVSFPVSVCWDSAARATSYRLQVAIDSTFATKIVDDSSIVTRCRQLAGLLNGKTYFWRVSAKNTAGISNFSAFFRFSTLSPPQPPVLISPADGEEGVNAVAQFLWSIPETAESYRFQLSRDSAFTSIVKDDSVIQVTSTQAGPLESHRKYFWRVRGKNTSGIGAYSPVFTFRTDYVGVSNWSMPLSVRENGNAQETVYFGLHPDASAGIDPQLDEYELPPPDFFGTFDVRFIGPPLRPSSIGEGLRLNLLEFRTYNQIDTFKIRFQPGFGGYPITFDWPAGFVRVVCDSMLLVDEFGGNTLRRRMDVDSNAVVTNSSLSSVLIIKYGAHPILDVPIPGRERALPQGFVLSQNYPNPFNPSTSVRFSTEDAADIDVTVYDVLGRLVKRLADRSYAPGEYSVVWDGTNEQGFVMPSGMYYVRMTAASRQAGASESERFSATRKMVMMK